jgi:membrane-associated protein
MPFLRTFAPIVAGIGQMKYIKFLNYNIFSAILWIISMTLIGFYLGRTIPNIEAHIEKVIIIIVFLSLLPAIIKFLKHKLSKKTIIVEE